MKRTIDFIVPLMVLFVHFGCENGAEKTEDENPLNPSPPITSVRETWSIEFENDTGYTGRYTLEKTSSGQILVSGSWCRIWCGTDGTYNGSMNFGLSENNDTVLTITGSGTATRPSHPPDMRTGTYDYLFSGVAKNGRWEGNFACRFNHEWEPLSRSGIAVANRTGGRGITD